MFGRQAELARGHKANEASGKSVTWNVSKFFDTAAQSFLTENAAQSFLT